MEAWTGRTYRGPITIGARCALTEYPIYVRRGGMVFSIPQRHTTGIAEWPQLVVDAFLSTDNGSRTQRLYEDDGITTAYEQGAGTVTEFTLRQAGCATTLTVAAGPKRREVVLRIHLPPASALPPCGGTAGGCRRHNMPCCRHPAAGRTNCSRGLAWRPCRGKSGPGMAGRMGSGRGDGVPDCLATGLTQCRPARSPAPDPPEFRTCLGRLVPLFFPATCWTCDHAAGRPARA